MERRGGPPYWRSWPMQWTFLAPAKSVRPAAMVCEGRPPSPGWLVARAVNCGAGRGAREPITGA